MTDVLELLTRVHKDSEPPMPLDRQELWKVLTELYELRWTMNVLSTESTNTALLERLRKQAREESERAFEHLRPKEQDKSLEKTPDVPAPAGVNVFAQDNTSSVVERGDETVG